MNVWLRASLLSVVATVALAACAAAQGGPVKERLGGRAGYIHTFDGLNRVYGGGGNLTLHFQERISAPLYLDFRVGAVYLGDSKKPELAPLFKDALGNPLVSQMRILFFSVGPQLVVPLSETWNGYVSVGAGIYSVSIVFNSGIQAFDSSDQHFGGNFAVGTLWRITDNWNIDLSVTAHHLWTKRDPGDLYYVFTGQGDASPSLLQIATGLSIDLR